MKRVLFERSETSQFSGITLLGRVVLPLEIVLERVERALERAGTRLARDEENPKVGEEPAVVRSDDQRAAPAGEPAPKPRDPGLVEVFCRLVEEERVGAGAP